MVEQGLSGLAVRREYGSGGFRAIANRPTGPAFFTAHLSMRLYHFRQPIPKRGAQLSRTVAGVLDRVTSPSCARHRGARPGGDCGGVSTGRPATTGAVTRWTVAPLRLTRMRQRMRVALVLTLTMGGLLLLSLAFLGAVALAQRTDSWLQSATTLGTLMAALAAAWAAANSAGASRASRDSASASVELVRIENERRAAEVQAELTGQAESIHLSMVWRRQRSLLRHGFDAFISVRNSGLHPILATVRLKSDAHTWGPTGLLGLLEPGQTRQFTLSADEYFPAGERARLEVSFRDSHGNLWIRGLTGNPRKLQGQELHEWREDTLQWASKHLDLPPRLWGVTVRPMNVRRLSNRLASVLLNNWPAFRRFMVGRATRRLAATDSARPKLVVQ